MKLVRLRLPNFRSFGPDFTEIELDNMTFLLGPNGAGKTPVLQAPAEQAGVAVLCNTVHRSTSGDAPHASLHAMNRHILIDTNGDISGVKFGPSRDDPTATLSAALSVLGFALHPVADLSQAPELIDDLATRVAESKGLGAPADNRPKQHKGTTLPTLRSSGRPHASHAGRQPLLP
jgi:hypothetical protein